ncbi:AMIN-like domain-containing (lipo)protein [Streptosporangium sp. NPDC003464]
MKRTHLVLALVPFVLSAAGCGSVAPEDLSSASSAAPASSAAQPQPTSSPGTSSSTPGRAAPKPPTSTKEVEVKRAVDGTPTVTGVRFAGHGGFDRVVIDLKGNVPGYSVRWVPELVQDGSGEPIDVKGGAYLQVSLSPASAHNRSGSPSWAGGPIFQAGLGNVRQVAKTGDFEAVVGVGIVLDHRAAFRVTEHKNPSRLVVDVAH